MQIIVNTKTMKWFFIVLMMNFPLNFADGKCLKDNEFDYIVVGSGSSGGPLASRLSETEKVRVLLLEAGKEPIHISEIPLISYRAMNTEMDWNFTSVSQKYCCFAMNNQEIMINRGKALGGTSSLNFMTYTRGFREDYNRWAELGNEGWSWDDVYPYFLKLEDYTGDIPDPEDVPFHHKGGPMTVEIPEFKSPMAKAFLQSGLELGYPTIDYNGKKQIGFMYPPVTTRNGSRCSTYVAYIKPAMGRQNFVVKTNSLVTKILIDEQKVAIGVVYETEDKYNCTAKARREVILSAGVIGSPQLLMLSGIGPKDHLQNMGIDVVVDLPGVGQNYHDHVVMGGIEFYLNDTVSYNSVRYETREYQEEWENSRKGPMSCPDSFEGVGFISTKYSSSPKWPDIEIFFNSDNVAKVEKPFLRTLYQFSIPPDDKEVISFLPILLRPKSRGDLKLRSKDPHDPPLINPNLLADLDDVKVLAEGVKFLQKLIKTKAFQRYGPSPIDMGLGTTCPLPIFDFHLPLLNILFNNNPLCIISFLSFSGFHPVGTCKMGPETDKMAVVNHQMKVNGVRHLRIADASIMPEIVAAHTSTSCIMIGEKLADMIKKEWNDPIISPDEPDPLATN